jgi:hypothetical protein
VSETPIGGPIGVYTEIFVPPMNWYKRIASNMLEDTITSNAKGDPRYMAISVCLEALCDAHRYHIVLCEVDVLSSV